MTSQAPPCFPIGPTSSDAGEKWGEVGSIMAQARLAPADRGVCQWTGMVHLCRIDVQAILASLRVHLKLAFALGFVAGLSYGRRISVIGCYAIIMQP